MERLLLASALVLAAACGASDPPVETARSRASSAPPPDTHAPASIRRRVRAGGPREDTEKALLEGLRWLARHQNQDGSWSASSLPERCDRESPCYDAALSATDHYDEGLTGLALLGFLGSGFTHESHQDLADPAFDRRYRTGDVVGKGLEWLLRRQHADGSFSKDRPFLYNEAIATMALVEGYGLTKNPAWREPAQKAVDFIQKAQRPNPSGEGLWGWRYATRVEIEEFREGASDEAYSKELHDSDTSVTSWCVMALQAARTAGLRVEGASLDGAMAFCKYATANDGLVGYLDAKSAGATVTGPFDDRFTYHTTTMSALGMCIRMLAAPDAGDRFLPLAAKRIVQDLPDVTGELAATDYYYWHCASLALHQLDGPESPAKTGRFWRPWEKAMTEAVLSRQDRTPSACSHGGWVESDRWASYSGTGPLYNTAMCVLTLQTYYRVGNVFGSRGTVEVGTPAPDFAGTEDASSTFELSDYRGRVVVVDFWSYRHEDAEARIEARSRLAERMRGRPFAILGVLQGETEQDLRYREAASEHGDAWRWTRDERDERFGTSLHWRYRIGRPTAVVVDGDGTIRSRDVAWEETEALAERLVGEIESKAQAK